EVRELLLAELAEDENFGVERIHEIAEFLLVYATRNLRSAQHPELRNFFVAQQWTALAYLRPEETSQSLADHLDRRITAQNPAGTLRLAQFAKTLNAPLIGREEVLLYAAGVENQAKGEFSKAQRIFDTLGPTPKVGSIMMPAPSTAAKLWNKQPNPTDNLG